MNLLPERLQQKIIPEPNTGCWLWTGALDQHGYGRVKIAGTRDCAPAHRMIYELEVGPIPIGLVLDHKCRVHCCVNPDHLEPVSHRINILRGTGASARNALKSICCNGHSLANAYVVRGGRKCRACQKANMARYYLRTKIREEG